MELVKLSFHTVYCTLLNLGYMLRIGTREYSDDKSTDSQPDMQKKIVLPVIIEEIQTKIAFTVCGGPGMHGPFCWQLTTGYYAGRDRFGVE